MTSRLRVTVGREGATASVEAYRHQALGALHVQEDRSAPHWPFRVRVVPDTFPPGAGALVIPDLHRAFPSGQTPGTRLVLTQATYQLQRWLDWLRGRPDLTVIGFMEAAQPLLTAEALARRGPWSRIEIAEVTPGTDVVSEERGGQHDSLVAAFQQADPAERVRAATAATAGDPENPALHLALASAHMETSQNHLAHQALGRALELDPDWEAVHFEVGKWCLRNDQMEHAAASFAAAVQLMPTFAAALGNLGAVLGELHRPTDALDALERALALDPGGYPVLNSIGAVHRDAGRLAEAERAFRSVIAMAPDFVFGYYNLGQTLLLADQATAACEAYQAGLALDPQRNPRQMMRLAVARAAAGDPERALLDVEDALARVSPEAGRTLLTEAASTLVGLATRRPGHDADLARVMTEVQRYST